MQIWFYVDPQKMQTYIFRWSLFKLEKRWKVFGVCPLIREGDNHLIVSNSIKDLDGNDAEGMSLLTVYRWRGVSDEFYRWGGVPAKQW